MARRRKKTTSRKKRKSTGVGRVFEGMAALVLVLVVLTFGISIASRFLPEEDETTTIDVPDDFDDGLQRRISGPAQIRDGRPEIEIQNGCGVSGLAGDFRFQLQGPEFDVVEVTDADRYDYEETLVVASESNRGEGEAVVDYMNERYGVGRLDLESSPSGIADVRVILGSDLADGLREGTIRFK